jgi:hypothetical protein
MAKQLSAFVSMTSRRKIANNISAKPKSTHDWRITVKTTFDQKDFDKANKWRREHREHVAKLVKNATNSYAPSGSDITHPEYWKDSHWRWFVENHTATSNIVDPISALQAKLANQKPQHAAVSLAGTIVVDELPYEIPLSPKPGTQVRQLTIGSTYRTPIPVLFDPRERVTYPVLADK